MIRNRIVFISVMLCIMSVYSQLQTTLSNQCEDAVLSETQFENTIVYDLHFTSRYVFLISNYQLFKSADDGATWTRERFSGTPSIIDIAVGENTDFLVITGSDNSMWISFDGGLHFEKKTTPGTGPLRNIQINPLNNSWIMASHIEGNCTRQVSDQDCALNLYLTNDHGRNWRRIRTYIWMYYFVGDAHNPHRVILWEDTQKFNDQRELSESVVSISVEPFFMQFKPVIRNVTGFLRVEEKIWAARPFSDGLGLYVSNDNGETFRIAKTPSTLKGRRFTILDASVGSTFINAEKSDLVGSIYVSNDEGDDFSLSLPRNPRTRYGASDFARIASVQGAYLANQIHETTRAVQTVVTFSEGGQWERPTYDGCNSRNPDECSVNLLGNSDRRSEWFSHKNNPGVLFANGNVGVALTPNNVSTLISRDAGQTWKMIKRGLHRLQMDDTGSLLVMANNAETVNEVSFSLDQGEYFANCRLPGNGNVQIDFIAAVPGKPKFIMFGRRARHEVVISLDMSTLGVRPCSGITTPDRFDSDYELWSPADCINGRQITYMRRRRHNVCMTPIDAKLSQPLDSRNCLCTDNDYQCAFCFVWDVAKGKCVLDTAECPGYDPNQQPEDCHGYWFRTSGYRLVPGNTCIQRGGVIHTDTKKKCL